jgi:hypothetical protein
MDTPVFHSQSIVEDVLKKWPQTFSVFRSRNTDCVGCILQRFCTLQNVAETYELPLHEFINDLQGCVNENIKPKRSTL